MASSLAKSFARRMGNATRLGVKPCTLTRVTPGERTPGAQSTGTNPTTTTHTCRAFVGRFEATQIDETTIKSSDRMICVFAESIDPAAVPDVGDKLTIDDETFRIVGGRDGTGVQRDPAGVMFSCHGRK